MEDMKTIRTDAINRMQRQLDSIEPVPLPYWAIAILMSPVFVWEAVAMSLKMLFMLVVMPLKVVFMWLDMLGILAWYLKRYIERMARK